jgi:oligoendopeptidase F
MRSSYKQNCNVSIRFATDHVGNLAVSGGNLPSWNLSDLYSGVGSAAYASDCARAAELAERFEARWQGRLATEAVKPGGGGLAAAIIEFESFEELVGRIMSFAGLSFFSNTSDPALAKFYGDAQEKMTEVGSHLLFFTLELNKIDDGAVDAAMAANPALGRYRPWIGDLRKAKPHQLEDKVEKLFLEQSVAGRAAWNRLFDETMSALRFSVGGEELALEAALNLLQDADPAKRKAASHALAKTLGANLRLFTQITNTLAKDKEISDRWHGFHDIADSRHLDNRVEREVVDALTEAVKSAYPRLSHRYYAMKAKWLGMDRLHTWDRNAPLPETPKGRPRYRARRLSRLFPANVGHCQTILR